MIAHLLRVLSLQDFSVEPAYLSECLALVQLSMPTFKRLILGS